MKTLNPELTDIPIDRLRRRNSYKWARFPDDVLPAWVAEMDFPLATPVRQALSEALDLGDCGYSYPKKIGFGEAFAGFARARLGWHLNSDWVLPAISVFNAISATLSLITKPGDTVIVTPPFYVPFYTLIHELRCQVAEAPLLDGKLDPAAIDRRFAEGATTLVLCSPHNPSGSVPERAELAAIADSAARHHAWVLVDEVHAPLVLPGSHHIPFLSLPEAATERSVAFSSASKAFNIAGLKCALVIAASERLFALLQRLPTRITDCGHFGAIASVAAFREGGGWLDDVIAVLDHNRRLVSDLLNESLPDIGYCEPQAGYLAWLNLRSINTGCDPSATILDRGRLAVTSGLDFGSPGGGFVRLNFGTTPHLVEQAIERLVAAVSQCRPTSFTPRPRRFQS